MYSVEKIEKARANLKRTNLANAEAAATRADAVALVTRSRRWRVEGSRGGTSKIMGKKAAERAAQKYGGTVVDLKPPAPRVPKHSERPCPTCKAKIGESCRSAARAKASAHAARKATAPSDEATKAA